MVACWVSDDADGGHSLVGRCNVRIGGGIRSGSNYPIIYLGFI